MQTHRAPVCLDGAGACPPEDVGGVPGYEEVADWLRAGARDDGVPGGFDDAEHARGWLPPGTTPTCSTPLRQALRCRCGVGAR